MLKVKKIKELIGDLKRNRVISHSLCIIGKEGELVEEYKYLGVHLDS